MSKVYNLKPAINYSGKDLQPDVDLSKIYVNHSENTGTFEMAEALKETGVNVLLKTGYSADELFNFFFEARANAVYTLKHLPVEERKFKKIMSQLPAGNIKTVSLRTHDNSHNVKFINFVAKIRKENPDIEIIAGPVAIPSFAADLIRAGANAVTTGFDGDQTALYTDSITNTLQIVKAVDAIGGKVISCVNDNYFDDHLDIAEQFATGAYGVIVEGAVAASEEADGETKTVNDALYKNGKAFAGSVVNSVEELRTKLEQVCVECAASSLDQLQKNLIEE